MLSQTGFSQINVPLDAAQDFIADGIFIAELKNGFALHLKRFVREAFVFGGKKAERRAGALTFCAFHLPDVVFVFNAQALQCVGFGGIAFGDFIQAWRGRTDWL